MSDFLFGKLPSYAPDMRTVSVQPEDGVGVRVDSPACIRYHLEDEGTKPCLSVKEGRQLKRAASELRDIPGIIGYEVGTLPSRPPPCAPSSVIHAFRAEPSPR